MARADRLEKRYREYGSDPDKPRFTSLLFGTALLAVAAYSAGTVRHRASEIMRKRAAELSEQLAQHVPSQYRGEVSQQLMEVLTKPVSSFREAYSITMSEHPLMKAWEYASKRVFPVELLDLLLKGPELRYAGRHQAMLIPEETILYKQLRREGTEGQLFYLRGAAYELEWSKEFERYNLRRVREGVYPVKGSLSYFLQRLDKGPRRMSYQEGVVGFFQKQLDTLHVPEGHRTRSFWRTTLELLGLGEPYEMRADVEFMHRSEPLKNISDAITALRKGLVLEAIEHISPGHSVSIWGKRYRLPGKMKRISAFHLAPYNMLYRLSTPFRDKMLLRHLALTDQSSGSALDLYSSIFFKRLLPIYFGYEALKYAAFEFENITGADVTEIYGDIKARALLNWATVKDVTGITGVVKTLHKIAPEVVSHIAHPLSDQPVGLSRKELEEYLRIGREPIRKGRWWFFGSGVPIRGEKIQYFAPNWYQRTRRKYKDYMYTGTRYGSKREYWMHSWLPTPRYPYAPLLRLFDPYWLERKHYKDRPYPVSAPMFEHNIFGTPLNLTIGLLFKPPKYMHKREMSRALKTHKSINEAIRSKFYEQSLSNYWLYITGGGTATPMKVSPIPGAAGSMIAGGGVAGYLKRAVTPVRGIPVVQPTSAQEDYLYNTWYAKGPPISVQRVATADSAQVSDETIPAITAPYHQPIKGPRQLVREANIMLSQGLEVGPYSKFSIKQVVRDTSAEINKQIEAYGAAHGYRKQERVPGKFTPQGVMTCIRYPSPSYVPGLPKRSVLPDVMVSAYNVPVDIARQIENVAGIYGFLGHTVSERLLGINLSTMPQYERAQIGSFSREFYKDWNIGGLTGEVSEIFRRFIPKQYFEDQPYNPIHNMMPSWMPRNYIIDYMHGDPYTKIPMGEWRLPGAAHERLYGIEPLRLKISPSKAGMPLPQLVQSLIGMRENVVAGSKREHVLTGGEEAHRALQQQFKEQGILIGAEVPIYNKVMDMEGYIDAIVRGAGGESNIVEIKTKANAEELEKLEAPEYKHLVQLNIYMGTTGIHQGYLHYTTRRKPVGGPTKIFRVTFNPELYQYTIQNVAHAKAIVRDMVQKRIITPQELYTPFERFRVLADVAPYSAEYEYYKNYLSATLPKGSERRKEFTRIKKEVSAVKKRVELEPYRFRETKLKRRTVRIEKRLMPGIYKVKGLERPIRLAGIQVYGGQDERGEVARMLEAKYFAPGKKIKIGFAVDRARRYSKDVAGTMPVVAYTTAGSNINRIFLQRKAAREKETDYSPAAVHARFTFSQRLAGRLIEAVAHTNIPYIHNKFMPIDSPLEEYKRKEIYGKRFTQWKHPFGTMIIPAIRAYAAEGVPQGIMEGMFIGFLLGSMKKREHAGVRLAAESFGSLFKRMRYKFIGALIGGAVGAAASVYIRGGIITGKPYIPSDVRKRRKYDEYFDRLKYVKFKRLYEAARREIKKREGIDIEALMLAIETKGKKAKERRRYLKQVRREYRREGLPSPRINRMIRDIAENRRRLLLTPLDVMALQFRREYKRTMAGLTSMSSYEDIYAALPKLERDYFTAFLEAPRSERKEIKKLVPSDVRRILESKWEGKPYEPPDIKDYFRHKFLPPKDWIGWLPWRSLEDYKLAALKAEGEDVRQFGFWPADLRRIKQLGIKNIQPFRPAAFSGSMAAKLKNLLKGLGLRDVIINIYTAPSHTNDININMNITDERRSEIENYITNNYDVLAYNN